MKIFISSDIEGATATATWDECRKTHSEHPKYAKIMTREVAAACEGAFSAGATEVFVKDAHGFATSIDIELLPEDVQLLRSKSGHPFSMVEGLDESFDAILFVGYHSAASKGGNFLSHTMTKKPAWIKMNGEIASEFMIFSYAAATVNVPTVFLSGDKMLCEDSQNMHPALVTTPVKDGTGALCRSYTPKKTERLIKENVIKALSQDFKGKVKALPPRYQIEICYTEHSDAHQYSFYPGMVKKSETVLTFEHSDYFEVLRMFKFCL